PERRLRLELEAGAPGELPVVRRRVLEPVEREQRARQPVTRVVRPRVLGPSLEERLRLVRRELEHLLLAESDHEVVLVVRLVANEEGERRREGERDDGFGHGGDPPGGRAPTAPGRPLPIQGAPDGLLYV